MYEFTSFSCWLIDDTHRSLQNDALSSLDGLGSLNSTGNLLYVGGCRNLVSFSALPQRGSVPVLNLTIDSLPQLTTLNGL